MSKEVVKYDGHRFDDIFYAFSELFKKRCVTHVCWSSDFYDSNVEQMAAFPIDIVRPYVERLLQVHGSGPLLHTIIAANFECEPMPFNIGRFGFIVHNVEYPFTMKNDLVGLVAAFRLDEKKTPNTAFECPRCESSVFKPEKTLSIYKSLCLHAWECEMSIDDRYLKPLTKFWRKCDQDSYLNYLHKVVAETVLMKLGLLIVRPKWFDKMPFSAYTFNRRLSLRLVLFSRKRPRFNDDALNKMVEAGYYTNPYPKALGWRELKNKSGVKTRHPIIDSKITCFCCHHEVTLSAEFISDPWRYHAKKSPSCRFLLMKMGMDYVKQVQESTYVFRSKNRMEPPAVIDPESDLQPGTAPMGEFFDLCKGMTDRKKTELLVALSETTVPLCTVCINELRTVAFMSCLHIATCVDCSFAIRDCPLCRTIITGFMMPVFQPDGSFWKQPDCVGGNYFMNLPCRHLIESCVPSNDNSCPKAHAMEEDKIYCAVCGNMNLGKIKVYL